MIIDVYNDRPTPFDPDKLAAFEDGRDDGKATFTIRFDELPDDHDCISDTIREAEKVIYQKRGQDETRLVRFTGLRLDWQGRSMSLEFELC